MAVGHPAVVISGVHSGPSPSAGVGVARCLGEAYDEIDLIGVDYSLDSTGLEWPGFKRIAVPGPWDRLDLENYAERIRDSLDEGQLWISCLDRECRWLAGVIGDHPNCCSPRSYALEAIHKPAEELAATLGLAVPSYMHLSEDEKQLSDFLIHNNCAAWLKGPHYGAIAVSNWSQVQAASRTMSALNATRDGLILQSHVSGSHYTIAFAAWQGALLSSVGVIKEQTTAEGKTWSGSVHALSSSLYSGLVEFCRKVNWCGGGEIECLRDDRGQLWLMECNPRFPAWIYGAAIAGHNLPAALVAGVTGLRGKSTAARSVRFTRLVVEVAACGGDREHVTDPRLHELTNGISEDPLSHIHPSGMAVLARRLGGKDSLKSRPVSVPASIEGLSEILEPIPESTPSRIFLSHAALAQFSAVSNVQSRLITDSAAVTFAYSIKTNPDRRLLKMAIRQGFLGEAISQPEALHAISCGWKPSELILNGPGKWWPSIQVYDPVGAIFCDSLEELERVICAERKMSRILGIRVRPTNLASRFGVSLHDSTAIEAVAALFRRIPEQSSVGLHFHVASRRIGAPNWFTLVASIFKMADMLSNSAGKAVSCLDLGGGFAPSTLEAILTTDYLSALQSEAKRSGIAQIILEPGSAIARQSMAVIARVLDVRNHSNGHKEVVVDGSTAELPDINSFPHRIVVRTQDGRLYLLGRGSSVLLGRLCMESDVLAEQVEFPPQISVGDVLYFMDAGAYDSSMSIDFGTGARPRSGKGARRSKPRGKSTIGLMR